MSPTQRSLKLLRSRGYTCGITEHWNGWIKRRQDLFGFVDILAADPRDGHFLFVQTTTQAHVAARLAKISTVEAAHVIHQTGGVIVVHGWARRGPRGKRKVWTCTETAWCSEPKL